MRPSNVLSDEDDLRKIWCHGFQCWRIAKVLSGTEPTARDPEPFTSKSLFLIHYRLEAGKRPCFLTLAHWPVLNWMLIWVQFQIDACTGDIFWAPHWLLRNWAEWDWRGLGGFVFVLFFFLLFFSTCVDSPSITAMEYIEGRFLGSVLCVSHLIRRLSLG